MKAIKDNRNTSNIHQISSTNPQKYQLKSPKKSKSPKSRNNARHTASFALQNSKTTPNLNQKERTGGEGLESRERKLLLTS